MTHEETFLISALWKVVKHREESLKYYYANKSKVLSKHAKWQRKNLKRMRVLNKASYARHKETTNKRTAAYQKANPERTRAYARKSYHKNSEKARERSRNNATRRELLKFSDWIRRTYAAPVPRRAT